MKLAWLLAVFSLPVLASPQDYLDMHSEMLYAIPPCLHATHEKADHHHTHSEHADGQHPQHLGRSARL